MTTNDALNRILETAKITTVKNIFNWSVVVEVPMSGASQRQCKALLHSIAAMIELELRVNGVVSVEMHNSVKGRVSVELPYNDVDTKGLINDIFNSLPIK